MAPISRFGNAVAEIFEEMKESLGLRKNVGDTAKRASPPNASLAAFIEADIQGTRRTASAKESIHELILWQSLSVAGVFNAFEIRWESCRSEHAEKGSGIV